MSMKKNINNDPVTLVFSWKVKKGKEKQFERWAHKTTQAAAHFEGHLGANWIKPAANAKTYTVIYKFDTVEHFSNWEDSPIRHKLLKQLANYTENDEPKKVEQLTGLETWFTLPGSLTIKPPPRWKMLIATAVGIYPLGLFFQAFIAQYLHLVPLWIRPIILIGMLTPLMTYVVMPFVTKQLKPWLYPSNK